MHTSTESIRTPDQRLRVFVSSTLEELAEERRAVTRAVSALRLTPVIFEAGARPHPPRDLYTSYLAQSDIFIGIYGQRYGWIAPGMEMSGLEEEFQLAQALPRLMYVKAPAPERDPRLDAMLARVTAEGAVSYRQFRTSRELGRLVREDLAALVSERFNADNTAAAPRAMAGYAAAARPPRPLPLGTTALLGREQDVETVADLLTRPGVRLVTLTGGGGIGKTRLALAVGERVRDRFDAGTAYVPLDSETDPGRVVSDIGRAVGADLAGMSSRLDAVVERIGDDRWLLILDNLEQVLGAGSDVSELLLRCRGTVVLATSRTALRLRAEHEYPVPALPVPADSQALSLEQLAQTPAVALFVDRARAVRPDFALTAANAAAVVEICRRLEGLPLAIELAAARTRSLPPAALLRRLSTSLDALGTGPSDLPERQQTLRVTVDWSVNLLRDAERSLLESMAVFVNGWTVEAAVQVTAAAENRVLELLDALARQSLIRVDLGELEPRYGMLDTIRAFVAERLAARADVATIRARHADWYRGLAERADRPLQGFAPNEWAERLQAEAGNLSVAAEWYLGHDRAVLPRWFRALWPFRVLSPLLGLGERLGEPPGWIDELLPTADDLDPEARTELLCTAALAAIESGDDPAALRVRERVGARKEEVADPYLQGVSELVMAWISGIAGEYDRGVREAATSRQRLGTRDDPLWRVLAALTLGGLEAAAGRHDDAYQHLTEARDLADGFDDKLLAAACRVALGAVVVAQGRLDQARVLLEESLELSARGRSVHCLCMCLAGFALLLFVEGDAEQAALVAGAAAGLRQRTGVNAWPSLRRGEADLVAHVRQVLGSPRFERAFTTGERLNRREAVAAVRDRRPAFAIS